MELYKREVNFINVFMFIIKLPFIVAIFSVIIVFVAIMYALRVITMTVLYTCVGVLSIFNKDL
ncbi:hypothetical protein BAE46_00890 [Glaciecola punicea]|jgi:hypothetical protein|nr:hypothetical protein BAE46_00890 [Glaciecola punicea]